MLVSSSSHWILARDNSAREQLLAAQRDDLDHDDEWGEFNQAGGYNWSIAPQLLATGNHEYIDVTLPNGQESRTLGPYFPAALRLSQTSLSVSAANPATEADTLQFSVLNVGG